MRSRPQIDLTQERSVRAILAATVRLYRAYPLLFALLALGVVAPFELGELAITGYGPLRDGHESAEAVLVLLLLRTSLITPLIGALHMHAVVAIGEGRKPRLGTVAISGLRVLPVVAAAAIASSIGIGLGFIALIVPGILLALRWAVVAQAAALEGEGWLDALRSSQRLTATHYGHVFGLTFLTGLLAYGVSVGARSIPLGSATGVGSVAVGIAVDTAIASFAALTLALLYFDLQARPQHSLSREREHPHVRDLD
jgi:hypothetical protein